MDCFCGDESIEGPESSAMFSGTTVHARLPGWTSTSDQRVVEPTERSSGVEVGPFVSRSSYRQRGSLLSPRYF
jgi:hypothetical protein